MNEYLTIEIGNRNGYKLKKTLPITDILSLKGVNKSLKNQLFNRLKVYFGTKLNVMSRLYHLPKSVGYSTELFNSI
ncbi:MAG TPA: hypothetical protein VF047_01735 [Nitrososphaeraceae archaeon]|jgi:hypothetical protein